MTTKPCRWNRGLDLSKGLLTHSGELSEKVWDEACGKYILWMVLVLIDLFGREVEFIPVLEPIPDVKALAYIRIAFCCMVQCENQNIRLHQRVLTTTYISVLLPVIINETSCASIPNFQ